MRLTAARICALLGLLLLAQAGLAFAAPRTGLEIDPSFGRGGVVVVKPGVPGHPDAFPAQMAGTRTGGFFVLESAEPTDCRRCSDWYLVRYGRTGARDRSFGFVPVALGLNYYRDLNLSVDTAGRPLVFWKEKEDVIVRRFTPRGRTDASFARNGRLVLHCNCFPDSMLPLPGGRTLLVSEPNNRVQRAYKGSIPMILLLREDGIRDRAFGNKGVARPRLHGRLSPHEISVDSAGGIVFSGNTCCGFGSGPYVARLRADGRIDRDFGLAARRALERLPKSAEIVFTHGLVVHRNGEADLYGELSFGERAFVLKLNRDGSLHRSFGHRGMKALPRHLLSADADGQNGAILMANQFGTTVAYRVGPDVRIHGAPRVRISIGEEEGAPVEAQPGGKILVFDRGLDAGCRQFCISLVRVDRLRLRPLPLGPRH